MKVFYSDSYTVPLPEGHRFPMHKYRMLRDSLVAEGLVTPDELFEAPLASREALLRAHDGRYVDAFLDGTVDPGIVRKIGLPWSPALVRRSLASVGGFQAAAWAALEDGLSGNLAGGTHHALRGGGEGYCVFNDLAVTSLELLALGKVRRIAIIDLDVHQGNGTAEILGGRSDVFILDLFGRTNFPFHKVPATRSVPLEEGTGDNAYLQTLAQHLPEVFAFGPDLILYQTGVDALQQDFLGKLALTHAGLMARDRLVLRECQRRFLPVALALGGGYARPIEPTVQAYVGTYRVVRELYPQLASRPEVGSTLDGPSI